MPMAFDFLMSYHKSFLNEMCHGSLDIHVKSTDDRGKAIILISYQNNSNAWNRFASSATTRPVRFAIMQVLTRNYNDRGSVEK